MKLTECIIVSKEIKDKFANDLENMIQDWLAEPAEIKTNAEILREEKK